MAEYTYTVDLVQAAYQAALVRDVFWGSVGFGGLTMLLWVVLAVQAMRRR